MVTFIYEVLSFSILNSGFSWAHICGLAGLQLWALQPTVVPPRAHSCKPKFSFNYSDIFLR